MVAYNSQIIVNVICDVSTCKQNMLEIYIQMGFFSLQVLAQEITIAK